MAARIPNLATAAIMGDNCTITENERNIHKAYYDYLANFCNCLADLFGVLKDIGRIDVLKFYHNAELIVVAPVPLEGNTSPVAILKVYYDALRKVRATVNDMPYGEENDFFSIREFIGSVEKHTVTVIFDV